MSSSSRPAPSTLSRRAVASGLAWSVPAVASVSAAPAFAASPCVPTLRWSGGLQFHWGDYSVARTTQVLQLGAGQVSVDNLPAGVTVVSMTVDQHVQRREGQTTRGPGAFYPGNISVLESDIGWNATTNTLTPTTPTQNLAVRDPQGAWQQFNISTAYPKTGSGWSATIQATNGLTTTFKDGQVATAWRLRFTWSATQDSVATYTTNSTGCVNFTSESSGRFNITYQDVVAPTRADNTAGRLTDAPAGRADITVKLSDGRTLTYTTYSGGYTAAWLA